MKRRTITLSDEKNERLHNGDFGPYNQHGFNSKARWGTLDYVEISMSLATWEKLGKPNEIKVTITAPQN